MNDPLHRPASNGKNFTITGLDKGEVWTICASHRQKPKQRKYRNKSIDRTAVYQMYDKGMTGTAIAKEMGVAPSTIYYLLKTRN